MNVSLHPALDDSLGTRDPAVREAALRAALPAQAAIKSTKDSAPRNCRMVKVWRGVIEVPPA